jgi:hypothetical protein
LGQTYRGLIIGCEGHIDVMKYDKFQSLLMNRHTECEDVMKEIDAWGRDRIFMSQMWRKSKSRTIFYYLCGVLAMTRTSEQK